MDPVTIITAITGLVTALAGTGLFVRRKRRKAKAKRAAAAAATSTAEKIAAVGRPPGDDG
jgi:LPXTG-motif cell wall-anchored protein